MLPRPLGWTPGLHVGASAPLSVGWRPGSYLLSPHSRLGIRATLFHGLTPTAKCGRLIRGFFEPRTGAGECPIQESCSPRCIKMG